MLSLNAEQRRTFLASLTSDEAKALAYDWSFWARDKQHTPAGDWLLWILRWGRGAGKTRSGSEWIRERVESGTSGRIALVGQTPADVRDVMIEGESGILTISPPWNKPLYEPSKRRLTWPNGATALAFSGHDPEKLRGPQFDTAWLDELAAWKYPKETFDNLMLGLRIGQDPRGIITSTPKPIKLIRDLEKRDDVVVTTASTYENLDHLAPAFFNQIRSQYEGTRTGRQEIYAELMDEAEGALWRREWIKTVTSHPDLVRIVVAIDPAATSTEDSDETGIIAAGVDENGIGYVLGDRSGRYSPNAWAETALQMFDGFSADRIIGETNNGGEMIESTLRTVADAQGRHLSYKAVHASRGKQARAEPVAALYERGKVFHVGLHSGLEDQLVTWEPSSSDRSPDRLDALVWALTELMLGEGAPKVRILEW